jgi:uncharacterized protein YyaL (SSP411 family)
LGRQKNILFRKSADKAIATKYKISLETLDRKIKESSTKLLSARAKRVKPRLDDKILTAWNGLMLKGYVAAYRAFDEPAFLNKAIKTPILNETITDSNEIMRNYKITKLPFMASSMIMRLLFQFIELYQATFNEKWLYKAKELNDYDNPFYDSKSGMFFYTHNNHSNLIARKWK